MAYYPDTAPAGDFMPAGKYGLRCKSCNSIALAFTDPENPPFADDNIDQVAFVQYGPHASTSRNDIRCQHCAKPISFPNRRIPTKHVVDIDAFIKEKNEKAIREAKERRLRKIAVTDRDAEGAPGKVTEPSEAAAVFKREEKLSERAKAAKIRELRPDPDTLPLEELLPDEIRARAARAGMDPTLHVDKLREMLDELPEKGLEYKDVELPPPPDDETLGAKTKKALKEAEASKESLD